MAGRSVHAADAFNHDTEGEEYTPPPGLPAPLPKQA